MGGFPYKGGFLSEGEFLIIPFGPFGAEFVDATLFG